MSSKSVIDFIPGHRSSNHVIFLGLCPSTRTTPMKNGTFARLDKWAKYVGLNAWSFHNVIHDKVNSTSLQDVDSKALLNAVKGKKYVIALGGLVERACKKHSIPCYRIDHPSPRNRNFNDKCYEPQMLARLKRHLQNED